MKLEDGKEYICRDGKMGVVKSIGTFGPHNDNAEATFSAVMRNRTYWGDGPNAGKVYHAERLRVNPKGKELKQLFIPGDDPLDVVWPTPEPEQLSLF